MFVCLSCGLDLFTGYLGHCGSRRIFLPQGYGESVCTVHVVIVPLSVHAVHVVHVETICACSACSTCFLCMYML